MASSKCNPKVDAPSSNFVDRDPYLELEAEQAENDMLACRVTLAELLPRLDRIREYYAGNRGHALLRGCKTWHEFCVRRLRVTPQAIHICAKRLNLTAAQKEAAAKKAKEEAQLRRMYAKAERENAVPGTKVVVGLASSPHAYEVPDNFYAESEDDAERVVPAHHVHALLAALEQVSVVLDRITASGLLTTDLELAAATKRCAARTAKVTADTRKELGIGDGKAKVVNIADRVQ